MKFTTRDNDNDKYSINCASLISGGGAWWFNYCLESHLNGAYYHNPAVSYATGIIWYHWKGWEYSLKFTEMKTRRNK